MHHPFYLSLLASHILRNHLELNHNINVRNFNKVHALSLFSNLCIICNLLHRNEWVRKLLILFRIRMAYLMNRNSYNRFESVT